MDKCIEQTIHLNSIFRFYTILDKYKNTEKWNECVAKQQENIEKYIEKFHNSPHKRILDSLLVSDQEVRKQGYHYWQFPNSKKSQKIRIIDSCNQLVLDEMIEKYDYPNERNGMINNPHFIIGGGGAVLIHYSDTIFLRNVEYKALIEGKLSPDYYAMKARQLAYYKYKNLPILDYTYHYTKKMTPQEKEQVNKNRHEIGLPSVEEGEIIRQCVISENKKMIKQRKKMKKK